MQRNILISIRGLGVTSLIFGFLGGAFSWWTPLGMVLSLTGALVGFVGWINAPRKTVGFNLALAGTLLSLATLILGCSIAAGGWELVSFQALR